MSREKCTTNDKMSCWLIYALVIAVLNTRLMDAMHHAQLSLFGSPVKWAKFILKVMTQISTHIKFLHYFSFIVSRFHTLNYDEKEMRKKLFFPHPLSKTVETRSFIKVFCVNKIVSAFPCFRKSDERRREKSSKHTKKRERKGFGIDVEV
jgi:hypothetical protein